MVMQITGTWGKITIFNIYNDGESEVTVNLLMDFHHRNRAVLERSLGGEAHIVWLGDFNRHHPLWDSSEDIRLFINKATEAIEKLIDAVTDMGSDLVLPSRLPMHEHSVTKQWTRLDQVVLTAHSGETLIYCDTVLEERGVNTDHLPVLTELRLEVAITEAESMLNFWDVNWEEFRAKLKKQLDKTPTPAHISNQAQLDEHCKELTKALQETIRAEVPTVEIMPKSKRWWTKELTHLCACANKLGRVTYNLRNVLDHRTHKEHKEAKSKYQNTLKTTKQ
jgi:hypothetical protein